MEELRNEFIKILFFSTVNIMKRVFITTGVVFVISISVFPQNTVTGKLTLQQCVETGIANNLDVLQSDLQVQADEINWKQSKLDMLPDLNGSARHGTNSGRSIDPFTNTYLNQNSNYASYGLNSGVTLFNGFSMQNFIKQNKLTYEASKMTLQQRKDNLTLNIILAYLQVLNSEDILVQARNQSGLTKNQVDRLEILNKEGAVSPSQLSDLKGQYAGEQLGIITAESGIETAKINLCQLMNVPYDKNITVERLDASVFAGKYQDTPDKIYETALQQFAQVKAADLTLQSAEKAVRVVKGRLFPALSLNGGIGTNYSNTASSAIFLNTTDVVSSDYVVVNGNQSQVIKKQNNFSTQKISYSDQLNNNRNSGVSLDLRIPIFNSFQQRNNIKLAKLALKSNELIVRTAKTQLQQLIEQAYINMTTASERQRILLEQVNAFTESFRAAEIRFNEGVGNSIDYLTAKNNLDRANLNLINAKYEYVLRIKILDYYKGIKLW
jgi:outer membrane protein